MSGNHLPNNLEPTVWRLHVKPSLHSGVSREAVFDHCINNNLIGIGWELGDEDETPNSVDEYIRSSKNRYKGKRDIPSIKFARDVQIDDIVWTRNSANSYYIGLITGDWKYVRSSNPIDAIIPNQRSCFWYKIGLQNEVPGALLSNFRSPKTLQAIRDEVLVKRSKQYLNREFRQHIYPVEEIKPAQDAGEFFTFIDSEDCEDVVGLYLQKHKDYLLVPSSCKRTTMTYEYVLIHKKTGAKAVVQVKQGSKVPDMSRFKSDNKSAVYVFSTKGEISPLDGIEILDPLELFEFAQNNKDLLPDKIRWWLDP